MPQLGETVTEGTITKWFKAIGDPVAVDDLLFEVSTDKVDTEVPSAHPGFLRAILVAEGDTVPIGTLLAVITATAEEPIDDVTPAPAASASAAPPTAQAPPAALSTESAPIRRAGEQRVGGAGAGPPDGPSGTAPFLSPVVRRLLDEHGISAAEVTGSGEGGRITRSDVLAAAAIRRQRAAAPAADGTASPAPWSTAAMSAATLAAAGPDDEVIPHSNIRRVTAEHMTRSLRTSAHTLVAMEVDYSGVDAVRRPRRLTYLPFVARAVVDAIAEYPQINASFTETALVVHRRINLGMAVDLDFAGLVVPVLRDAPSLRLPALADALADLSTRARSKRLTADDLTGGTFTITNAGGYGTMLTAPVINQPQVAILSTDGVKMRPVAVRAPDGEWVIAVHPMGNLALSFDHRAVDGAYASAFLAKVRQLIETRDWAQEL